MIPHVGDDVAHDVALLIRRGGAVAVARRGGDGHRLVAVHRRRLQTATLCGRRRARRLIGAQTLAAIPAKLLVVARLVALLVRTKHVSTSLSSKNGLINLYVFRITSIVVDD